METPAAVAELLGEHRWLPGYGSCRVLAGNGLVAKVGPGAHREAFVLSGRLGAMPITVPKFVDAGPDWVVMCEIVDTAGANWSLAEYEELLDELAVLHDAFDDSQALRHSPFQQDLRVYLERVSDYGARTEVSLPIELRRVLDDPEPVVQLLEREPTTLVHTDPYPANVLCDVSGQKVWIDWEDALAGPAALDVAGWLLEGPWKYGRSLDQDAAIRRYLRTRPGDVDAASFRRAVDAATLFLTPSQNLDALADTCGQAALDAFVAERVAALARLGLDDDR